MLANQRVNNPPNSRGTYSYSVFCFVRSRVIRGLDAINSMLLCLVTSLNIFPGLGSSSSDETMRSVLCVFVVELLSTSSAREDTVEFELSRLNASTTGGGADVATGQSLESSWPPIISLRTKEPSIASRAKNKEGEVARRGRRARAINVGIRRICRRKKGGE